METLEGPLNLGNVEYQIFRETIPEVFLGQPILQSLVFGFNEHLANVREK